MTRRQGGLTLLEFTLVMTVIGLLMVLTLEQVVSLRIAMERAAVERTVAAMETGAAIEFARLIVAGEGEAVTDWESRSPLEVLETEPILPGFDHGGVEAIGPGRWSYDAASREVVYHVRFVEALGAEASGEGRWRPVIRRGSGGAVQGLGLEQTQAIDWP